MSLFFSSQVIAFVLEGKKSQAARRPKSTKYQRLEQQVHLSITDLPPAHLWPQNHVVVFFSDVKTFPKSHGVTFLLL